MRFVFPAMAYEAEAKDYIREHREHQSEINGSAGRAGTSVMESARQNGA